MTRRHLIAIGVAVLAILTALAQPIWTRATGDELALGLRPVDPLSLFRGNYVDLVYDVDIMAPDTVGAGASVYVVFDGSRPARPLRVTTGRPDLAPTESCLRGRVEGDRSVGFPHLEQHFVTPEDGRRLERDLDAMVGVIRATDSCRSILVAIEPE